MIRTAPATHGKENFQLNFLVCIKYIAHLTIESITDSM